MGQIKDATESLFASGGSCTEWVWVNGDKVELNRFYKYIPVNLLGQQIKHLPVLWFGVYNGKFVVISDSRVRWWNIVESDEFTYKFKKTIVKTVGERILVDFFVEASTDKDSPFSLYAHAALVKALEL